MEFTTKDWIVILVPIVLEGLVFFVFQAYFNEKMRRFEKKLDVKDNVINTFLSKIMFIRLEYENIFNRGEEVPNDEIQDFFNLINPTFHFFQANECDLEKFKKEYQNFYDSWFVLIKIWNNYVGSEQNPESVLGKSLMLQLEECKQATDTLIYQIRNKGFLGNKL